MPVILQACSGGDHAASSPQHPGQWQAGAGGLLLALGKQQSLQIYCWRAKPTSLAPTCVPHLPSPIWASGFKLPQWRWLPEQEAGGWLESRGQGTLSGTPLPWRPLCLLALHGQHQSRGGGLYRDVGAPPAPRGNLGLDLT